MSITDEGEYGKKQIDTLEMIWGEGYLSPGGASEIDLILNDKSLKNKKILDIGMGVVVVALHSILSKIIHQIMFWVLTLRKWLLKELTRLNQI